MNLVLKYVQDFHAALIAFCDLRAAGCTFIPQSRHSLQLARKCTARLRLVARDDPVATQAPPYCGLAYVAIDASLVGAAQPRLSQTRTTHVKPPTLAAQHPALGNRIDVGYIVCIIDTYARTHTTGTRIAIERHRHHAPGRVKYLRGRQLHIEPRGARALRAWLLGLVAVACRRSQPCGTKLVGRLRPRCHLQRERRLRHAHDGRTRVPN